MKNRSIYIIIVVFILMFGVLGVKSLVKNNNKVKEKTKIEVKENSKSKVVAMSLSKQYEEMKKSLKPSIIILSYEGDCCENTKKFFNEYNSKANKLMKDYEKKFTTLYINTGILEGIDKETLIKIADENGTSQVPAILIRDSKGKVIKIIEGTFDDKEVRKLLEGVKN